MFERWESLEPAFEREFKKCVSIGELTVFLANLSGRTGLVLTTKAVYLLRKKWWKVKCEIIPLIEIETILMEDRERLKLQSKTGIQYFLEVDGHHFPQALKAINRGLELINKVQQ